MKFGVGGHSDQAFNASIEGGFKSETQEFESPLQNLNCAPKRDSNP